jgi:Holliday junction resolvase RusA-like endonuclease
LAAESEIGLRLSVFVPGRPGAKPRARTSFFDGKGNKRDKPVTFTPTKGIRWETEVKEYVELAMVNAMWPKLLEAPMDVSWVGVYPRPKTRPGKVSNEDWKSGKRLYFPSRPDRDNTDKSVLDACTRAEVWADDMWAVTGRITKVYASVREEAHLELRIMVLPMLFSLTLP